MEIVQWQTAVILLTLLANSDVSEIGANNSGNTILYAAGGIILLLLLVTFVLVSRRK